MGAKKWLVQGQTTFYGGGHEIFFILITCLFRGHWGDGTFRQPFFWLFFVTKSPNWIFLKDKEFFGVVFPIRPLSGHIPDFWYIFAIFFWFLPIFWVNHVQKTKKKKVIWHKNQIHWVVALDKLIIFAIHGSSQKCVFFEL